MAQRHSLILAALAAVAAFPLSASAALTFHEIAKWQTHTQTSNSAPVSPSSFLFSARVFANVNGQVQNGTVSIPGGGIRNTTPDGPTVTGYYDTSHASLASLDAMYTTGTYTFTLTNGPFAGASDTVNFQNPGYSSSIPFITGTSYSSLQGMDPTQSRLITWNTWTSVGDATGRTTYFYLYDMTAGGTLVASQVGSANTNTSYTIAANQLLANRNYRYQLLFGALTQQQTQGPFNPSFATASMYMNTIGNFSTVPEPTTMGLLGVGLLALARRRYRRAA